MDWQNNSAGVDCRQNNSAGDCRQDNSAGVDCRQNNSAGGLQAKYFCSKTAVKIILLVDCWQNNSAPGGLLLS